MTDRITIKGRMPGLNEYIAAERTNRYKAAALKREWTERVTWAAVEAFKGRRYQRAVYIRYRYFEANRRRDKDNVAGFVHKVVQDGLVKAAVIDDDGWRGVAGWADLFYVDADDPRIEIEIEEASE